MKFKLFFACLWCAGIAYAQNYGEYKLYSNMDFENGTCADALGNANTLLQNGATITSDTERNGKVVEFKAAQKGNIKFQNSPLNDQMTISFWFKREAADPTEKWRMMFAFYADNANGSNLYFTPRASWSESAYVVYNNKIFNIYTSVIGKPIVNNQWKHYAVVFNDSKIQVYQDGALQSEAIIMGKVSDIKATKWFLGCNPETNYPMDGKMDNVKIYHSALAANQIKALSEDKAVPAPSELNPPVADLSVSLDIDCNTKYQTIRNFGSSDGWNIQSMGLYLTENQKEDIAEKLFSTDFDESGNPKGIGLSAWRFNIGAGTYEQGTASRIATEFRRTECFLNNDKTTYNWNKQAGQRYFLEKAAKTYKVPDIIGWQNSPPVMYTVRGLGFREYGDPKTTILKTEHFSDFGNFLSDVINHFKQEGININYISPLNEPQFDWGPTAAGADVKQEGSPWTNQEITDVVKAINTSFQNKQIDSEMFITEAAAISYVLGNTGHANNQLATFRDPASNLNINNLSNMSNIVSSHSYWDDTDAGKIVDTRKDLVSRMKQLNPALEYWQTEYCLLGDGYKFGFPSGANLSYIQCGIAAARIIHSDLVFANAAGWQWWTTVEHEKNSGAEERWSLFRLALTDDKSQGVYRTTKLLSTMGQFSFFIRPGMKRLDVKRSDNMDDKQTITNQMFSAYIDEKENKVVIVAINASTKNCAINLSVSNLPENINIEEFTPYITSETDDMKCQPAIAAGTQYVLPAYSIVTFVGKTKSGSGIEQQTVENTSFNIFPNPATSRFNIQWKGEEKPDRLSITNLTGQVIHHNEISIENKDGCSFSTASLSPGTYLVTLLFNDNKQTQKLIIR